jgi:hypothetical protein
MNTPSRTVFGMTIEEVDAIKNSVLEWTDSNHPFVPTKKDEDGFCIAFVEGSKMLIDDAQAVQVFKKVQE